MARIVKVFKTLRNHWKKSTFAACVLTYGGHYLYDKYETHHLMRAFCEEARSYGEQPLPLGSKPRHVTVVLNPTAKDGKGKSLYEKYAAPLFHLAGFKVSLFQTEHKGQAGELMKVMDNTNAVVIAGGDGTLHEAVTGLMNRPDFETACNQFGIGVIPTGRTNSLARTLYWNPDFKDPQWAAESAMAVIRDVLAKVDVMKIEFAEQENPSSESNDNVEKSEKQEPLFAVAGLEQGVFRDTDSIISKYWYLGPLKIRAAYFFRGLKEYPKPLLGKLTYKRPCSGCSKCYIQPKSVYSDSNKRWWSAFVPRSNTIHAVSRIDYSKILNEDCGLEHEADLEYCSLDISANTHKDLNAILVEHNSPNLGRIQFMKEGWKRHFDSNNKERDGLYVREVSISFNSTTPEDAKETNLEKINIDSEEYDLRPLHITVYPKQLNVYSTK